MGSAQFIGIYLSVCVCVFASFMWVTVSVRVCLRVWVSVSGCTCANVRVCIRVVLIYVWAFVRVRVQCFPSQRFKPKSRPAFSAFVFLSPERHLKNFLPLAKKSLRENFAEIFYRLSPEFRLLFFCSEMNFGNSGRLDRSTQKTQKSG